MEEGGGSGAYGRLTLGCPGGEAAEKLDRASADLKPARAVGPVAASGRPAAEPTDADGLTIPDQTWTVVQLRAEARARGIAGMSNKPKAKLLAALTRDA